MLGSTPVTSSRRRLNQRSNSPRDCANYSSESGKSSLSRDKDDEVIAVAFSLEVTGVLGRSRPLGKQDADLIHNGPPFAVRAARSCRRLFGRFPSVRQELRVR